MDKTALNGAVFPNQSAATDLRGRFIVEIILHLVRFWGRHGLTLRPAMQSDLAAALDVLTNLVGELAALNIPGPD